VKTINADDAEAAEIHLVREFRERCVECRATDFETYFW